MTYKFKLSDGRIIDWNEKEKSFNLEEKENER